jgi:hypothetical protein
MGNSIFDRLHFQVHKEIFYEILENRDRGFGYTAKIKKELLDELHLETFDFIIRCFKKKILGRVHLTFSTSVVGEILPLERRFETIEDDGEFIIIKDSY